MRYEDAVNPQAIQLRHHFRIVAWKKELEVRNWLNWVWAILGGYLWVHIHIVVLGVYGSDSTDTGPDSIREWWYCRSYIAEVIPVSMMLHIHVIVMEAPYPPYNYMVWSLHIEKKNRPLDSLDVPTYLSQLDDIKSIDHYLCCLCSPSVSLRYYYMAAML